jgi:GNAT superfamily N-acetyltransferase
MPTSDDVTVRSLDGQGAAQLLGMLSSVYADAYGVEPSSHKATAFEGRARQQFDRPGFDLVTAHIGNRLVGFAFGYTLKAGDTHWWGGVVPEPSADFLVETGSRTFVLSEIEVRRDWQQRGVGRQIHDALLTGRVEERATLATSPDAPTQSTYERWGWRKVGRIPGNEGDYFSAYDLFVLSLADVKP